MKESTYMLELYELECYISQTSSKKLCRLRRAENAEHCEARDGIAGRDGGMFWAWWKVGTYLLGSLGVVHAEGNDTEDPTRRKEMITESVLIGVSLTLSKVHRFFTNLKNCGHRSI